MESRTSATGIDSAGRGRRRKLASPAYGLHGVVMQAVDGRPTPRAIAAWFILRGEARGVDLSGLTLLTVRGPSTSGRTSGILLVDERARPEVMVGLLDIVQGRLGSPPADLAGTDMVYQVPVEHQREKDRRTVAVPGRLRLVLPCWVDRLTGPLPMELANEASVVWVPNAAEMSVTFPEHDLVWVAARGDARCDHFHFVGSRQPPAAAPRRGQSVDVEKGDADGNH